MRTASFLIAAILASVAVAAAFVNSAAVDPDGFTLAGAVPNDAFLFVSGRHNPERAFLDRYWGEVMEALDESGVAEDVTDLVAYLIGLGGSQSVDVERIRKRGAELFAAIDWNDLGTRESAFAERFAIDLELSDRNPPILMPEMVAILRGTRDGAARNFEALAKILEAFAEELGKAIGTDAMKVERSTRMGAQVASLNMLAMVPGAQRVPLSVARHGDVIVVGMRENLFEDVLTLLDGKEEKTSMAKDPRFNAAFATLPKPEDKLTFFDFQNLVTPIRSLIDRIIDLTLAPRDMYQNSGMSAEVAALNAKAIAASRRGDLAEAMALTKQAHAAAPECSILLYNMACIHALLGEKSEALTWLEQAIDGGFYGPRKIAGDADLASLRGEPRYRTALDKATAKAAELSAPDTVTNAATTGEVYRLRMQVLQAHEDKNYEQGLKIAEQAHALAPKDSQVLYVLACLHSRLGHRDKSLDLLQQAVQAGFYCPQHISRDSDLANVRDDERYHAAVTSAREFATEASRKKKAAETRLARHVLHRMTEAVGTLDFTATVEFTDGYATKAETTVALVPDAANRPIYPVFAGERRIKNFDRYLPQETESFAISTGIDVSALYKFLEDSVRGGGPLGEELIAKWGQIQKQFEFDLQADVVGWMQTDSINVTLANGAGTVAFIKVADEKTAQDKVSAAFEFVSKKIPELTAKQPALAGLAMLGIRTTPLRHEKLDGFQNIHFGMAPQPVAVWGVADGYLIWGSTGDAVALCLATAKGEHPSIRANALAMSEAIVPEEPFVGLSLTDQRKMGEEMAAGMGLGSMMTSMMGAFIPEPRVRPLFAKIGSILNKMIPVVQKIDFYKSTAKHTTFDGQAWHTRRVTHMVSPDERASGGTK